MQAFKFPLEKVRQWRSTQLELEEAKLDQFLAERQRIESTRAQLQTGRASEEKAILRLLFVESQQLSALDRYQHYVEDKKSQLHRQIADCDCRIAAQRARVVEARRNLQLLEKLKQRRLAEWELEFSREQEAQAAESFLARWAPP